MMMRALPEFSVLLLGWHFDDSGLVDDPRRPLALLHDADDPSLVALLFLNVLAISGGLLPGQADEESSRRFGGVTLEKLEHVTASLGHGGHLGDDWQVVDDEADLVLLVPCQRLGVTQQSK